MVYQLHNEQEAANAIYQIQIDATEGQLKVSDFQWFVVTIQEAISKKLKVTLRYDVDTPAGLEEHHGIIESAELCYNSGNPNPSTLSLDFNDMTTNTKTTLSYTFNAELVEENKNSAPGNFMKYYINDDNHNVIVGLIFNYR